MLYCPITNLGGRKIIQAQANYYDIELGFPQETFEELLPEKIEKILKGNSSSQKEMQKTSW